MRNIIFDKEFEYRLLLGDPKESLHAYIREEATEIFFALTGENIPIDEVATAGKKYISLGNTSLARAEGVTPQGITRVDGYTISVKNGHIFVLAEDNYGVLYGLYRLFELMGVTFYAEDEWSAPEDGVLAVEDCSITENPSIENRVRGMSYSIAPKSYETRMKYNIGDGRSWITWAHTHFAILPKERYYLEHKDWYNPEGNQLCLTNEEMRAEFVKNVKERIDRYDMEKSSTHFLMLGHEDNGSFCSCERCRASNAEYGGAAGTMMNFVNAVADEVNAFVKERYPTKTVKTVTFAYGPTVTPPVVKTEEGYAPVRSSLVAHENVCIMIAPLGSDWYHSLTDEKYNAQTALALKGWSALNAEFFIWTYGSVFDDLFIFIDDYEHLQESYQTFERCNASYIFDEGSNERYVCFEELSNFVKGRLMWNTHADLPALIEEFTTAHYKEAKEEVFEYFNRLRENYRRLNAQAEEKGEILALRSYVRTNPDYRSEKYWKKQFLLECVDLLNKGLRKAEKIKDKRVRKKVCRRVRAQRITPVYLLLELYFGEFEESFLKWLTDTFEGDCRENKIFYYKEHGAAMTGTVENKIHEYRSQID